MFKVQMVSKSDGDIIVFLTTTFERAMRKAAHLAIWDISWFSADSSDWEVKIRPLGDDRTRGCI